LDANQRQAIESAATQLHFRKKAYIFRASQTHNVVYIVLEGRVKLFRLTATGHECIQWFCLPGDIFGLSEHDYQPDNGLYAQTLSATDVYAISKTTFNQLVTAMPSLALLAMEQLTLRVRTLGDMLLHVTCDDAAARLSSLLQRLGVLYGRRCNDEIVIDLQLTHQDIADMIGVCRQTVSTLMAQLKRRGILRCDRRTIALKQLTLPEQFEPVLRIAHQ
jgi:CRP-like cAMP-binding protein